MNAETSFIAKTAIGILAGLLISTGVLPAESKDAFSTDAATAAGYIITILSTAYMLEHALVKVKSDFDTKNTTTLITPSTPVADTLTSHPTTTQPVIPIETPNPAI